MSERERANRRGERADIAKSLKTIGFASMEYYMTLLIRAQLNLAETVEAVSDTLRDIHEGGA